MSRTNLVTALRRTAVSGSTPRVEPRPGGSAPAEVLTPGRASGPAPRPSRPTRSLGPVWIAIGGLLACSLAGLPYYLLSPAQRVRSPWHPWLRPSGYVGQAAGILALAIFLFLWLYPLRKRYRWLAFTGAMARWLDAHVALALVLPFLAAIHAAWRFDGVIGLGFWAMIVVCVSGVVGRYLYVHIPRSQSGLELSAEELAAERRSLLAQLALRTGLPQAQVEALLRSDPAPCDGLGIVGTLRRMVSDDLARWRAARALRRACASLPATRRPSRRALATVMRLASREMALTQQARMLEATHRLFRYWHVAHRPFAVTALAAVLVHVGVVVAMGATWFW